MNKASLALILSFAIGGCATVAQDQYDVTAKTEAGVVSGTNQGQISSFLGIPYAAAPVGSDRWKAPRSPEKWNGVKSAKAFGPSCPQAIVPGGFGPWTQEYVPSGKVSEDCLTLNVWTPQVNAEADLPVLVWIHGGGFTSGSASVPVYDGAELARQGVVVVSLNYRLGLLGFFASPEFRETGGGNFGLQDQLAALHWVKRNIAQFGGDPARVTVAGQSAGAASVHAMILSPKAAGLFQQAIPQSGIGLGLGPSLDLPSRESAEAGARRFLDVTGAQSVEEARKLSLDDLTSAYMRLGGRPGQPDGYRPGPYADGSVLPLDPGAAFANGRYNDTPTMIGLTADEGSGLNQNYRISDPDKYRALLDQRFEELAQSFAALYPPSQPSVSYPEIIRDGGIASVLNWADERSASSQNPLYGYIFTHVEPGPESGYFGAFHTSEVPYIFRTLNAAPDRPFTDEDWKVERILSSYWVNFIKTGNPNGPDLPSWPAYGADFQLLELGDDFRANRTLGPEKRDLFRRHLEKGGSLLVF